MQKNVLNTDHPRHNSMSQDGEAIMIDHAGNEWKEYYVLTEEVEWDVYKKERYDVGKRGIEVGGVEALNDYMRSCGIEEEKKVKVDENKTEL